MCLLCVMEPNNTPTREQLLNAAEANPHGFGFAIMTDDRILTGRGMNAEEVIDRFLHIRQGFPDSWAMFHTRYTTHGTTSKANCHPFRVAGDPDIVLAHNGVLPLNPADDRSDTRLFAEEWLPELGIESLDDETTFAYLEHWAKGSKIAIFSRSEVLEHSVYILNEHLGHWKDGIWWSNYSYEPYKPTAYSDWGKYYDSCGLANLWDAELADADFDEEKCEFCLSKKTVDLDYMVCRACGTCMDCFEDVTSCLCFMPDDQRERRNARVANRTSSVYNKPETLPLHW